MTRFVKTKKMVKWLTSSSFVVNFNIPSYKLPSIATFIGLVVKNTIRAHNSPSL